MERDWWSPDDNPAPAVREFVGTVNAVASQEQAIKLRAARILAWMKTKDLSPLNVPGWTACVEEYSPWSASTTREYVRLAESPLEIVREAAVAKMIDLAAAGRALRTLSPDASPEEQLAFVEKVASARQERWPRAYLDVISGDAMRRIIAGAGPRPHPDRLARFDRDDRLGRSRRRATRRGSSCAHSPRFRSLTPLAGELAPSGHELRGAAARAPSYRIREAASRPGLTCTGRLRGTTIDDQSSTKGAAYVLQDNGWSGRHPPADAGRILDVPDDSCATPDLTARSVGAIAAAGASRRRARSSASFGSKRRAASCCSSRPASRWSGRTRRGPTATSELWHTPVGIRVGTLTFERSLEWIVNDGLMVIFFFVVGMEIRREIHHGELSEWRRAALPAAAALGGMVAPAPSTSPSRAHHRHGRVGACRWPRTSRSPWASSRCSGSACRLALRVLLLALAVIDDLGAIVVIALFYSSGVALSGLAVAALAFAGVLALQRFGVRSKVAYVAPRA